MVGSYTYVEVEASDNCPMSANQVYRNLDLPFRVAAVRIYEGEADGRLCAVTGWSSRGDGSATDVYAVRVEDSSEGSAYVVYGGDWGIRLRPPKADGEWSVDNREQWGETHLVLADEGDIVRA